MNKIAIKNFYPIDYRLAEVEVPAAECKCTNCDKPIESLHIAFVSRDGRLYDSPSCTIGDVHMVRVYRDSFGVSSGYGPDGAWGHS